MERRNREGLKKKKKRGKRVRLGKRRLGGLGRDERKMLFMFGAGSH